MYGRIQRIHFVGIGGIGMSGIAEVLANMGYRISGSDIKHSSNTERLKKLGIKINIGHSPEHVEGADVVVVSSAIDKNNVEIKQAMNKKIPVIPRAEMLSELMRLKFGIAVVGSHGKTTTTSMISSVLYHGKLDPTIVVGGKLKTLGSNARLGKGKFMVVEADESDGSFKKLSPVITVLTNIDTEHLDYYNTIENLEAEFESFLDKIPFYGLCVLCIDCQRVAKILPHLNKRYVTYGMNKNAHLSIDSIKTSGFKTLFEVKMKGETLGEIILNIPGRHNAINSLAAIAVGLELGIDFEKIKEGLYRFEGIERRLQLKGKAKGITIIDDYGHHPSEIQATLKSLQESFLKKPIVIFQPHRYSRTKILFDDFVEVLSNIDELYLLDIYPAGEKPIDGISSEKLAKAIISKGKNSTYYVNKSEELVTILSKKLKPGDIVLTSGAGNVWIYGEKLLKELR